MTILYRIIVFMDINKKFRKLLQIKNKLCILHSVCDIYVGSVWESLLIGR